MECEKFSQQVELISVLEQVELISVLEEYNPLLEEAIEHLKNCSHCQEIKLAHQELDELIKEKIQDVPTPPLNSKQLIPVPAPTAPCRTGPLLASPRA